MVLFLTGIFPTRCQAAEQAGITGGQIGRIWGTDPVGLFAIQSANELAERIHCDRDRTAAIRHGPKGGR